MTCLNCRPVAEVFEVRGDLRKILMKKLWPSDNYSTPQYIDKSWQPYIQGLIDANIRGAEELFAALDKHDRLMFDFEQE